MPQCIYCLVTKPEKEFEPEHVLSRALCGSGENWTLREEVCAACNRRFSRFEAHWFRQAFEAMARNFSGPTSRNEGRDRTDRNQPVEIDGLFMMVKDDSLIYEAGFAFPNDPHLRPQCIDTENGLIALTASMDDAGALQKALAKLQGTPSLEISVPIERDEKTEFYICTVQMRTSEFPTRIVSWQKSDKPKGLWLRSYRPIDRERYPDIKWTSRMALDHRGRLYLRSANIETAISFFDTRFQVSDDPVQSRSIAPGHHTVLMMFRINLNHVAVAVLKTGFNLFCHFFGAAAALSTEFALLRKRLMDDYAVKKHARRLVQFDTYDGYDFPKSGNPDEHRMQIDLSPGGFIRFRLRLYDSIGYVAHLGYLPEPLRAGFATKRVRILFSGQGMEEVTTW